MVLFLAGGDGFLLITVLIYMMHFSKTLLAAEWLYMKTVFKKLLFDENNTYLYNNINHYYTKFGED